VRSVSRSTRRGLLGTILGGCLIVGVLPAVAANQEVQVANFSFTPSAVAVRPGEIVTWTNAGSSTEHNVHFDGEAQLNASSTSFTVETTFSAAGEFQYRCDVHPASMRGTVSVNDTGTVPTATPTVSPTASPNASPGTTPLPSATPAPTSTGIVVSRFIARAARASFCAKRSRTCKRPGVVLSLQLGASDSVLVTGTLRRRPLNGGSLRRFGAVAFSLAPGARQLRLPVRRRLTSGRYELTLLAGALTRRVQFRVRAA
jgi:plastocyanin